MKSFVNPSLLLGTDFSWYMPTISFSQSKASILSAGRTHRGNLLRRRLFGERRNALPSIFEKMFNLVNYFTRKIYINKMSFGFMGRVLFFLILNSYTVYCQSTHAIDPDGCTPTIDVLKTLKPNFPSSINTVIKAKNLKTLSREKSYVFNTTEVSFTALEIGDLYKNKKDIKIVNTIDDYKKNQKFGKKLNVFESILIYSDNRASIIIPFLTTQGNKREFLISTFLKKSSKIEMVVSIDPKSSEKLRGKIKFLNFSTGETFLEIETDDDGKVLQNRLTRSNIPPNLESCFADCMGTRSGTLIGSAVGCILGGPAACVAGGLILVYNAGYCSECSSSNTYISNKLLISSLKSKWGQSNDANLKKLSSQLSNETVIVNHNSNHKSIFSIIKNDNSQNVKIFIYDLYEKEQKSKKLLYEIEKTSQSVSIVESNLDGTRISTFKMGEKPPQSSCFLECLINESAPTAISEAVSIISLGGSDFIRTTFIMGKCSNRCD